MRSLAVVLRQSLFEATPRTRALGLDGANRHVMVGCDLAQLVPIEEMLDAAQPLSPGKGLQRGGDVTLDKCQVRARICVTLSGVGMQRVDGEEAIDAAAA